MYMQIKVILSVRFKGHTIPERTIYFRTWRMRKYDYSLLVDRGQCSRLFVARAASNIFPSNFFTLIYNSLDRLAVPMRLATL